MRGPGRRRERQAVTAEPAPQADGTREPEADDGRELPGDGPRGVDELYRVSQVVLSVARQLDVRDVLQVIVRSARSLVGARYTALGVPDASGSFAEFVVDGVSDRQWRGGG